MKKTMRKAQVNLLESFLFFRGKINEFDFFIEIQNRGIDYWQNGDGLEDIAIIKARKEYENFNECE